MFKEIKFNTMVMSIVYIILGLILLIFPDTTARTICYVAGGAIIALGVITIFSYMAREIRIRYYQNDFALGLLEVLAGIFFIWKSDLIISLIPFLFGFIVMISGFIKLQQALDIKMMGISSWYTILIVGIINVIFGLILLINPFEAAGVLFMLIGAGLLFSGISDIIINMIMIKRVKDYIKNDGPIDVDYNEIDSDK